MAGSSNASNSDGLSPAAPGALVRHLQAAALASPLQSRRYKVDVSDNKDCNSSTCTAHAAKSWPCSFRAPQARHADSRQMSINEHDKLLSVRLSECLLCSTFLPQKASMQGCKVDQAQAYEQVNEHPWHPTQAASAAWHSQGLGAASSVHAWQDCTHTLPNTPTSASRVAL